MGESVLSPWLPLFHTGMARKYRSILYIEEYNESEAV